MNHRAEKKIILFILIAWLVRPAFGIQKIKIVDGVKIIENKDKPRLKETVVFELELTMGGSEAPEESLARPVGLVVDENGRIYVADSKAAKIKIFSPEGKYIQSFGKKGQGPGELNMPGGINLTSDGRLMVEDVLNRKIIFFSREGKFLTEKSLATKLGLVNLLLDMEGNFIGREIVVEEKKMFFVVKKFRPDLSEVFQLDKYEFPNPLQGKINLFNLVTFYQLDSKGNILYAKNDRYEIKYYDPRGNLFQIVRKKHKKVKITQQDIDDILAKIPSTQGMNVKDRLVFSEYFPPISFLSVDPADRVYVRTYEKGKKKNEYWLDIFDPQGQYLARCLTTAIPFYWRENRVYSIEENEEGYQVVRRYLVRWPAK
jgi:hypothetical protein